jgi:3-hydroxybutyryl-CoA dehydrogenase
VAKPYFEKVAVIGAGTMGNGIAQTFAAYGSTVLLVDVYENGLKKGLAAIEGSLARIVKKGTLSEADAKSISGRITSSRELKSIADVPLVVEAVVEKAEVKAAVFAQLDAQCPAHTILATNTSSISITQVAASTKRADKVIGMHFMNPVPIMKLVEIVRPEVTSNETYAAAKTFAESLGKVTVTAKDTP